MYSMLSKILLMLLDIIDAVHDALEDCYRLCGSRSIQHPICHRIICCQFRWYCFTQRNCSNSFHFIITITAQLVQLLENIVDSVLAVVQSVFGAFDSLLEIIPPIERPTWQWCTHWCYWNSLGIIEQPYFICSRFT